MKKKRETSLLSKIGMGAEQVFNLKILQAPALKTEPNNKALVLLDRWLFN